MRILLVKSVLFSNIFEWTLTTKYLLYKKKREMFLFVAVFYSYIRKYKCFVLRGLVDCSLSAKSYASLTDKRFSPLT